MAMLQHIEKDNICVIMTKVDLCTHSDILLGRLHIHNEKYYFKLVTFQLFFTLNWIPAPGSCDGIHGNNNARNHLLPNTSLTLFRNPML